MNNFACNKTEYRFESKRVFQDIFKLKVNQTMIFPLFNALIKFVCKWELYNFIPHAPMGLLRFRNTSKSKIIRLLHNDNDLQKYLSYLTMQ